MGALRGATSGAVEGVRDLLWCFRHPFPIYRRCLRCGDTTERAKDMRVHQGGVCHDCFGDLVVAEDANARLWKVRAVLDEFDALDYRKQKAVSQAEFAKTIRDAIDGIEPERWTADNVAALEPGTEDGRMTPLSGGSSER